MKRKQLSQSQSDGMFRDNVNAKNHRVQPMRGGYRL